ncbi:MAG: hypothetical protein KGQ42_09775 [Alphaproteobacteria bacterium]|nr:hypothetical protein [Alphaproteobacteria bacterium]MDE2042334.1 hypothetical protein [Alphaproteobacteria bacterium]
MTMLPGARIVSAGEVAAEAGDAGETIGESRGGYSLARGFTDTIKPHDFIVSEHETWRGTWCGAIDHGHPEYAPGEDGEDGDEVDELFSSPQPGILGAADRIEKHHCPAPTNCLSGGKTRNCVFSMT